MHAWRTAATATLYLPHPHTPTPCCLQVTVDLKLTLPQVAVIGSQSSGKSSVLEALVSHGAGFLTAAVLQRQ